MKDSLILKEMCIHVAMSTTSLQVRHCGLNNWLVSKITLTGMDEHTESFVTMRCSGILVGIGALTAMRVLGHCGAREAALTRRITPLFTQL